MSSKGGYEKVSDGFGPGARAASRACSAGSRVARAFRRSDGCLRRCRPRVLVGSVLVALPAAVLRVRSAAGLHTAGAAHPGDAVVLVLLRERQGLLPDRPGVPRAVGQGSSEVRAMTHHVLPVAVGLLMTACATVPAGPSVMVLPGNGKSFE